MKKFSITAASLVGCIRSNNEDMILVWDRYIRNDSFRTELYMDTLNRFVIALADGMGGHQAGEVASQETLSNLHYFVSDLPQNLSSGDFNEMMVAWLNNINKKIEGMGIGRPEYADMGTTLVGIVYYGNRLYWMNCGDSRIYRFRNGMLTQLSIDHSLNSMMGVKKHSNIITNCIGGGCRTSYLDLFEFTENVLPGDVLMLCSDGLNDMIPDEKISSLMAGGAEAAQLCQAAIDAGGYDNVSVCVIKVE